VGGTPANEQVHLHAADAHSVARNARRFRAELTSWFQGIRSRRRPARSEMSLASSPRRIFDHLSKLLVRSNHRERQRMADASVVAGEMEVVERSGRPAPGELWYAAAKGRLDDVQELLASGAPVQERLAPDAFTPIQAATIRAHRDVICLLLASNADPNDADRRGYSPLHFAAGRGDVAIVRMLLEAKADTAATSQVGWKPLHLAAIQGSCTVLRLLLHHRADIEAKCSLGQTALHFASSHGHRDFVLALLEADAERYARDNDGNTPLDIARARHRCTTVALLQNFHKIRSQPQSTADHRNGIGRLASLLNIGAWALRLASTIVNRKMRLRVRRLNTR
jgi:hypothetical protein